MANVTISDLAALGTTADGTELFELETAGGDSKKIALADMVPGLTGIVSKLWTVNLSAAAAVGDKITVTATVKDLNGVTLASAKVLAFALASAADASYSVSDEGAGTGLTTGANFVSQITTNASGVAEIGFTDTAAETITIVFFTPQGPVLQSLTFT